jgi:hypothetical protein
MGKTTRDQFTRSVEALDNVGKRPVGAIVNMVTRSRGGYSYEYGYYYYNYRPRGSGHEDGTPLLHDAGERLAADAAHAPESGPRSDEGTSGGATEETPPDSKAGISPAPIVAEEAPPVAPTADTVNGRPGMWNVRRIAEQMRSRSGPGDPESPETPGKP